MVAQMPHLVMRCRPGNFHRDHTPLVDHGFEKAVHRGDPQPGYHPSGQLQHLSRRQRPMCLQNRVPDRRALTGLAFHQCLRAVRNDTSVSFTHKTAVTRLRTVTPPRPLFLGRRLGRYLRAAGVGALLRGTLVLGASLSLLLCLALEFLASLFEVVVGGSGHRVSRAGEGHTEPRLGAITADHARSFAGGSAS